MQVGIFSDIHGSLPALQSVWQALGERGLAAGVALNAGDNVGYGAFPEECIAFLRGHPNILGVRGNYDKNVALFPERQSEYRKKWGRARPEKFHAIACDSAAISGGSRAWLLGLPAEQEITLEGVRVLLTHYAPGVKEGLGHWTPGSRLRDLARATQARVVVCGHTHTPFVREEGGVLWVNPGSVGRALWGGPRFAVLSLSPDAPPSATLHTVKI